MADSQPASSTSAGTSGLAKDVQVASVKASLMVWLSFGLGALSFLLHIIAFSIPEWVVAPRGKTGLWKSCNDFIGCIDIKDASSGFKCVQAFATMAFILMVATAILTAVYMYMTHLQEEPMFKIGLIAAHGLLAFFLMIAFAVFSGEIINKTAGLYKPGASFGLEIVCFLLEIAATVALCLDFVMRRS